MILMHIADMSSNAMSLIIHCVKVQCFHCDHVLRVLNVGLSLKPIQKLQRVGDAVARRPPGVRRSTLVPPTLTPICFQTQFRVLTFEALFGLGPTHLSWPPST